MKQITLKSLMLLLLLLIGGGSYAWGETKTGTVTFGKDNFEISTPNVTGNDNLNNSWSVVTVGTGFSSQQLTYSQVGSSNNPATSITFTMSLPSDVKFTSFSAKFGGFKGTAGNISLTVDGNEVGSGSLSAKNDVVVGGELKTATTGKELKVTVTNIAKGVKCYNISYAYEDSSTPQPGEVAVPTLSLAEGTYWKTQTLTIGVPEGAAGVQYTLDGTDPKESNTAELITKATNLELSATTTVRAIAVDNNDNYSKEVSRTYTFVPSIANTKETAYTTVEAIAIINKTSEAQLTDEVVYVKGIVSKIDSYNDKYKSITYWLDDNTFQVYSGRGLDGKDFTSQDDIEIGANVLICGKIKKFHNNYEFDKENYLVEYKAPVEKVLKSIAISGEATKTTYFEGETFDPTGLVVTATYEDESTVDVTGRVEWIFNPETLTVGTTSVDVTANYQNVESASFKVDVAVSSFDAVDCEAVDFTEVFSHVTGKDNEEVKSYQGTSFSMEFAKPQSSSTPTKYYANGTAVRAYKGNTITITAVQDIKYVLINYVKNYEDNGVEIKGLGTKTVVVTTSETSRFTSITVYYKGVDFRAKSGENYYATFSCDRDVEFLEAEVFSVDVENGTISLNEIASKQVPANTGVLLRSTKESDVFTYIESAPVIEGTNLLKPASEKMTEGFKFYKLAYDNYTEKTGLGFYWGAAEGGAFTVKPGLAYLAVPQAQAANVKGFSFDGTQTSINGVEATTAKGAIYNLNGQRVEKAQRGIYIQNGKKFIVK